MKRLATLVAAGVLGAGCATVMETADKVKEAFFDTAWKLGLEYCQAPEERRLTYRADIEDELDDRAADEAPGTIVPKNLSLTCGPA